MRYCAVLLTFSYFLVRTKERYVLVAGDMLVVLLCCMMKIVEMATGKPAAPPRNRRGKGRRRIPKNRKAKAMNEVGLGGGRGTALSPDSDCNSNHPGSGSCLSNTSSQDIDFIQDNSDYQWFLDYGYRDNHHTSILSLPESYEASDIGYYDTLAKNMDANLAEADMESFRTEDIHALLTNLPPMCTTDHLSQENNRQGESFASVSGSMMAKFDFDSSMSPHSSSQGEDSANSTSMSICKSELLFSPVKETPMPGANFSVDSLDCELLNEHDIMLTCQANKDNYTIAFEGSVTMYSEDSDYHDTDKSDASGCGNANWTNDLKTKVRNLKAMEASMTQSDSGSFTTWSKLKKRSSENQLQRHPSGNNNATSDDTTCSLSEIPFKSHSMPNLHKQKFRGLLTSNYLKSCNMSNSSSDACTVRRKPVKVFDIQHQINHSNSGNGTSEISDMATSVDGASTSSDHTSKQQNFSLVKLFMKQKSMSAEGMSTALDHSTTSDNWPGMHSSESNISDTKAPAEMPKNDFEDSLLMEQKTNVSSTRSYEVIVEDQEDEQTRSESVEQLSECTSKSESIENSSDNDYNTRPSHFNINNNNSIEKSNKKYLKTKSTNTKHNTSGVSLSSDSSYTMSERKFSKTPKQVPVHLMNKSMQTSDFAEINRLKTAAPYKLNGSHDAKEVIKVIEPSFLGKLKQESEISKPVYVLYPSYALPNLDFLKTKEDDVAANVLLVPQNPRTTGSSNKKRPFSCSDMEALKRKGFGHVQDWDSLNFLLPSECRKVLADVPEIAEYVQKKVEGAKEKPSFWNAKQKVRPVSCDYGTLERTGSLDRATNASSSSSTATQPSSGYRGSSTMLLTDSQNSPAPTTNLNPLFVYRYDSVTSSEASLMISERQRSITTTAPPLPKRSISLVNEQCKAEMIPPRPPLPRGILRKSLDNKLRQQNAGNKRCGMFEMTEEEILDEISSKRRSLPETYYNPRNKRLSETEDEGVDAGTSSSSLDEHPEVSVRPPTPPLQKPDSSFGDLSCDDIVQLEEFLKLSGISSSDPDELDEEGLLQLRSYVTKFLSLKINQDNAKKCVSFAEKVNVSPKNLEGKFAPNNSPNVSALLNQRQYQVKTLVDMPICEEGEISPENYSSPHSTPIHRQNYDLKQKRALISAVTHSVEQIIHHFSPATNQAELNALGDSEINPACAKLTLSALCPALYAVLSDGLKPSLETSFGAIGNSVWQVVEALAQQGPLTKALNELVMRINAEDAITEGLVKFNAFVFGLLNVRSLDAWASYLRTRESILKKHYNPDSLLVLSLTGSATIRSLLDTLIASLQPLALLPFQFDLLFEYRQLHQSLKRMDSYHFLGSPTHAKHWKSGCSLHSNSDTEENSNATAIHRASPEEKSLPDLLSTSPTSKTPLRHVEKPRPRSCVDTGYLSKPSFKLGEDVTTIAKKRWSGISLTSKLYQAYNKLAHETSEEEYTDSLENNAYQQHEEEAAGIENIPNDAPESLDSNLSDDKPLNGRRFKKLQRKWEMLSGREAAVSPPDSPTHAAKSKIPRPVASPVKPSGIPVLISPTGAKSVVKKAITPTSGAKKFAGAVQKTQSGSNLVRNSPAKKAICSRTSRLDQLESNETPRNVARPSSLPYKPTGPGCKNTKLVPPRRAVSTSVGRKSTTHAQVPKTVRTLSHRLPSESGHLSYNEGERLKVVLEVDEQWLLCCRGTQKGLVPRSAVIADTTGKF